MLPFGVANPATVPQRSENPEGIMNHDLKLQNDPSQKNGFSSNAVSYTAILAHQ
jgi:hypothetical protein